MARNNSDRKNKSLNGVVLIMVVTVMFVLIIMLLATLSVVSTAQNRYYTKYEENQAYYTARSALDVFTNNLLNDGNYYAYNGATVRTYEHSDSSKTENKVNMKQGLALQLDLYKITAQSGDNVAQSVLNTYAAGISDSAKKKDEYKTYYGTDNSATSGVQTDSDGNEYIEYQITYFPNVSSKDNAYGEMVDRDKKDLDGDGKDEVNATIRVEVLDRQYNIDESKITDGTYADRAALLASSDAAAAFVSGTRGKDVMRLKITATVKFMDVESTAVLIYDTNEKETPSSDNALTATGNFSGAGGAIVSTAGGVATMDNGVTNVGDGNIMSGAIFSLGTINWVSSSTYVINKGESIVAMNGMTLGNQIVLDATADGTFMFLGGTSNLTADFTVGDTDHCVNLIAEEIITTDKTLKYYGDCYVKKLEIGYGDDARFKSGTSGAYNLYVKDIVLPNGCFTYDAGTNNVNIKTRAIIDSDIKLCKDYTISSADGTYHYPKTGSDTKNYNICYQTTSDLQNKLSEHETTIDPFDITKYTIFEDSDGRLFRKYKLPFNVGSSDTISVPTAQAYFSQYFKPDAFHKQTGELKNFGTDDGHGNYPEQAIYDPTNPINAYLTIYSDDNKNKWLLTGADILGQYLGFDTLTPGTTISSMVAGGKIKDSSGKEYTILSMPSSSCTIDLSSGDQYYVFDKTYYGTCDWKVTGNNGRLILLIEDNTANVDSSTGGKSASATASVTFENCTLTTDDITTTTSSIKNGTTKAPPIDIYGGTGSFINTKSDNAFCAYIMMPTGYIYMNNGQKMAMPIAYDNGSGVSVNVGKTAIVGSVLCNQFEEANHVGILYLDKNSGGNGAPGDPIHDFKSYQYARK